MKVKIKVLNNLASLPIYKSEEAAGFDLAATEDLMIPPGKTAIIGTGLAFEVPKGYELRIQSRSGLSSKTKLRVANSPGCIDSDFRGEVGVIMDNIGDTPVYIKAGDRIAQGILSQVFRVDFEIVNNLSPSKRGDLGLGSTGV